MTINLATERYKSDERLSFTASSAVTAGTPQLLDTGQVGIPVADIASGDTDEVDICGRFRAWGVASQAWSVGDQVGWDSDGDPLNGTAGSGAYTTTVANWDFPVGTVVEAKAAGTEMGVIALNEYQGSGLWFPVATQQALSGAGAVDVVSYYTAWTTTGAEAGTLADGLRVGQVKKVQLIVDGGDGTLTPATFADGTTITFADAGDYAVLVWTPDGWTAIELGNDADGASAPVVA